MSDLSSFTVTATGSVWDLKKKKSNFVAPLQTNGGQPIKATQLKLAISFFKQTISLNIEADQMFPLSHLLLPICFSYC